jgi:hypothetical protein
MPEKSMERIKSAMGEFIPSGFPACRDDFPGLVVIVSGRHKASGEKSKPAASKPKGAASGLTRSPF